MHDDCRAFQCSIGKNKRAAYWPVGDLGKVYAFACIQHHIDYENPPAWPHTACDSLTETSGPVQPDRHVGVKHGPRHAWRADLRSRLMYSSQFHRFAVSTAASALVAVKSSGDAYGTQSNIRCYAHMPDLLPQIVQCMPGCVVETLHIRMQP